MEQDHEVLDWGNEEEEHHQEPLRTPSFVEDADDAVSLGDEEDDNTFYSHQVHENGSSSLPSTVKVAESDPTDSLDSGHFQDFDVDESSHSHQVFPREEPQTSSTTQADGPAQNNSSKRAQNLLLPRLTHALPPKPVAASLPYLPPSHPSIVEATAMSARTREYKRSAGSADKPPSHHKDQLPPDWEIRHPRSGGRTVYYYNTVTHQSTWQHPGLPTSSNRTKSAGSSSKPSLVDSYVPQPLSYEDRHYRPGELPDIRRDDRVSDEPELKRPTTPPARSPQSRERLRSRSCSPPAPPREIPAENQEKTHSRCSNHDADLKEDTSHLSSNHSLHVSETSRPTASKSQNESSGHSNREINNQQAVPANLTKLSPLVNEDRFSLPRSSIREHNREYLERDLPHSTIEGRQGPNHSLSLSSSRPRSPPAPYDREWIPARHEQHEAEPAQNPLVKSGTTSRSAAASRRERPSRFDQPSTTPQTPPAVGSTAMAEQTAPRPVYIPADLQTSDGLSPPDSHSTRLLEQSPTRLLHVNRSPLTDNGPNRPVDVERPLLVSDQSGPPSRRKRAPLPPQAASFREETSRKRDHDPPRLGTMRPGAIPFPTLSQEYHSEAHSTGTSLRGTPQSVPHSRVESHVEHRRRVSSNDGQSESNNARRGNLTIDNEHSARGYPQTRAHPSIDAPMEIDVDRMPFSSSRVPSLPERAQDDDIPHRPIRAVSNRSSGVGVTPSTEASVWYPSGDSRREGPRDDILQQQSTPARVDHPPRSERVFHERPDRHGPRRESGGRSNELRAASSGSVPKLTGPNSVPIGTRRQTSFSNDLNPPVTEYASVPKFSAELPPRPLSIAPGKELYDRPGYDARTAVDNHAAEQHGYAEPSQRRQNISPSLYKRDHQSGPIDTVLRGGYPDNQPRERSRFGQPAREDRVPPTYNNESQSRTRSSSSERFSTRNRPPAQWPPPEARIPPQLPPPELPPGKNAPPRISEEDRYYRPGRQDHYRERTEDYIPSPIDDLTSRSRRPGIHFDGPYGSRTTEHPPLPPSPDHGPSDRNHYPPLRQQRPPERARPAELLTPNVAAASSERRTRRSDANQSVLASDVPDSPDHRAVRRLSVADRYEPDYGDGFSSRRRPRSANEDSQRSEPNHRGDVPFIPGPHHDQEFSRPSGRPLLDRLSLDTVHPPMNDPTVRDRVTIPEKRDRNTVDHDYPMDIPYEEAVMGSEAGEPVAKKARRRGHKQRRGRRGNGAG